MLSVELVDAVDELTRASRRKVMQEAVDRVSSVIERVDRAVVVDGRHVGTVTEELRTERLIPAGKSEQWIETPPLLLQLSRAIAASMGGTTRGARLASQSVPLDVGALHTAVQITSLIGQWCRSRGIRSTRDAAHDLRAWLAASAAIDMGAAREAFYIGKMRQWAQTIRSLLDPASEMDLPDPCPLCDASSWTDAVNGETFLRPLVVRYRPGDVDLVSSAEAVCRSCGETFGVRDLAWRLEEKVAAGDAPGGEVLRPGITGV